MIEPGKAPERFAGALQQELPDGYLQEERGMSACAMLTYNNMTQAAWQSTQQAVAQYGIQITRDSDSASSDGFTVHWSYNGATETLSIQCTDSPFLVPCSIINSKINDVIESCLNQHNIEIAHMVPG